MLTKIPILCYHSGIIHSSEYEQNDHNAMLQDLRTAAKLGFKILPIPKLIDLITTEGNSGSLTNQKLLCITFDDGYDFDYKDLCHLEYGYVPSFHTIISESRQFINQFCDGPRAIAFVIADPEARSELSTTCSDGMWGLSDEWWGECLENGLIGIANHSWDHLHDTLKNVRHSTNRKGTFFAVDNFVDAMSQVADAAQIIAKLTANRALPYFCYPYGHAPDYLVKQFLPVFGKQFGVAAAFGTQGDYATLDSDLWNIPRFVCGEHWKSPQEFEEILRSAGDGQ